jgi:outer membrane protein OmpA-like peptidoglycan-associated protein
MKKILTVITIIIAMFVIISCAKEQVKQPDKVGVDNSVFVGASNDQLSKFPVTGFGYKSSSVPSQSWDKWAKVAAPVIKDIVGKLPEGYVLEVRGHTDARGPEDPEGDKPGNLKISKDRASAVVDSLKKQGISSDKIVAKGVGSAEPLAGADPKGANQRRVTFSVVAK